MRVGKSAGKAVSERVSGPVLLSQGEQTSWSQGGQLSGAERPAGWSALPLRSAPSSLGANRLPSVATRDAAAVAHRNNAENGGGGYTGGPSRPFL